MLKKTCRFLKSLYICSMNFTNQKNIIVISIAAVVIYNSQETAF